MLTHRDVTELEAVTPKLVAESKDYLRKANEAYEDGDKENAELYARLAAARLETARNHVAARSARKLAKLMGARGSGLDDEADRARARQAELKRFGVLESRIEALHVELSRKPEGDAPEVTAAKQALAKARRKQAEAIGAGAAGLPDYQQGASLVSGAIESLEMGIYGESKLSSARALAAFDRAIETARAPKPDNSAADAAARKRAEDALSEASSAQTLAIAAGAAHALRCTNGPPRSTDRPSGASTATTTPGRYVWRAKPSKHLWTRVRGCRPPHRSRRRRSRPPAPLTERAPKRSSSSFA
jgi:hypothetical protein